MKERTTRREISRIKNEIEKFLETYGTNDIDIMINGNRYHIVTQDNQRYIICVLRNEVWFANLRKSDPKRVIHIEKSNHYEREMRNAKFVR
jgi:hypothetical protein